MLTFLDVEMFKNWCYTYLFSWNKSWGHCLLLPCFIHGKHTTCISRYNSLDVINIKYKNFCKKIIPQITTDST